MKILLFAIKKTLCTPLYWVFLLGALLLPLFFYRVGGQSTPPPAAYCLENASDREGLLLARYLDQAGFVAYTDKAAMKTDVEKGLREGAVLIPDDFTKRLENGEFEASLTYLSSATALFPDLWQNHTAAALFAVYSPYISAHVLAEEGVAPEEVKAVFEHLMAEGRLFHFAISTRAGQVIPDQSRSRRFFLGAMALLLFLSSYFCIAAPLSEAAAKLSPRIGRKRAMTSIFWPGLLLRGTGLFAAGALSCLIAGEAGLILPLLGTLAAMLLFHFGISLLPGHSGKTLLVFFTALFSLALMPMFMDFSLFVPVLKYLRLVLPPCWLWALAGLL